MLPNPKENLDSLGNSRGAPAEQAPSHQIVILSQSEESPAAAVIIATTLHS
jgi:hypothetical protein